MRERTSAYVMVDADQETLFQTLEPGALDTVTFQNNGRFIFAIDVVSLNHCFAERKWLINPWHSIAEHDLRLFAHRAQNLGASQHRADRIAVRPGVRGQHEPSPALDVLQYLSDHAYQNSADLISLLVFLFRAIQQFVNPGLVLLGAIRPEKQLRRTPQMQPLSQLVPNKTTGGRQSCQGAIRFRIIPLDHHEHASRARVRSQLDFANIDQANARIAQFAFQNRSNFLAQSLAQPLAMVLLPAFFRHIASL